jgi:hypothetical protein
MPLFLSILISYIYSITFIKYRWRFLSISSSLVSSVRKTSLGCRAENRTRACHTASRRNTNWTEQHPDWAAPHSVWASPHPTWAASHPNWATPHPTELRRTLLSCAIVCCWRRRNNLNDHFTYSFQGIPATFEKAERWSAVQTSKGKNSIIAFKSFSSGHIIIQNFCPFVFRRFLELK